METVENQGQPAPPYLSEDDEHDGELEPDVGGAAVGARLRGGLPAPGPGGDTHGQSDINTSCQELRTSSGRACVGFVAREANLMK